MPAQLTCGETLIQLLEQYGVDTVFGIPGVHTLDLYRGLGHSRIQHVQARNEQGAGFMADGYARVSGKPGVCVLISGPGVTNAATPLGQSFADSIPVLLISSTTASHTFGKGWGCLHEIKDQQAVTQPLTAMSVTALSPDELPELLGQAFSIFAAERPRPVHIAIPIDVLAQKTTGHWSPRTIPSRPRANPEDVQAAADLLRMAKRPLLIVGGGAVEAQAELTGLAERLNAVVVTTCAGKGVVPESYPLVLGGGLVRPEVQQFLPSADVVLAVGTELSETDSFVDRMKIAGTLIRIDLDRSKLNDLYPADLGIVADAKPTIASLLECLGDETGTAEDQSAVLAKLQMDIHTNLTDSEKQHTRLLETLRTVVPENTIFSGDICQLVYTGCFAMPVEQPRLWHYPAGYCTLGCGLPNGIGAKLALPEQPVVVLAGDGGFMFTVQELVTAAELELPLPIILWNNSSLKQIHDDMLRRSIPTLGVNGSNPDFIALAKACNGNGVRVESRAEFTTALEQAWRTPTFTLIEVREGDAWLVD